MRLGIAPAGTARTPAHPEVDGVGVAVSAEVRPDGDVLVHVAFGLPSSVFQAYRAPAEAVVVLVDLPELGACASDTLEERDALRPPPGPNWRGVRAVEASPFGEGVQGGWASARVSFDPPLDRPTPMYVRAALRDHVSPARRVDLVPAPGEA